ncbi:MAG TPA: DUF134 domain-containing protein [Candidatus Aenigmarchaeota archaeon]|nr:DUF134 domain-containing protein [Candidatus Aenigmarchaeota archaeon]
MPRWRWGCRRWGPGRPFAELFLFSLPRVKEFVPRPCLNPQPIELSYPEFEVLRLVDLESLTQSQAAQRMRTSRGTVWRLLENARKKVVKALVESRPLVILPKGEVKKLG